MSAIPPAALKAEVERLNARGLGVEIWERGGQHYAFVPSVLAPAPPWDRERYDILIPVPLLFDDASLDGFYLGLPYSYSGGAHERVNGGEITLKDRPWKLVSWHYLSGKEWVRGKDTLETHITHCRGFFLARGVKA